MGRTKKVGDFRAKVELTIEGKRRHVELLLDNISNLCRVAEGYLDLQVTQDRRRRH